VPAATSAPRATAARALIMTVPCHRPLRPFTDCQLVLFPDVVAGAENDFVPPEFCVVPAQGTKHCWLMDRLLVALRLMGDRLAVSLCSKPCYDRPKGWDEGDVGGTKALRRRGITHRPG
jgi:hypothetical protein